MGDGTKAAEITSPFTAAGLWHTALLHLPSTVLGQSLPAQGDQWWPLPTGRLSSFLQFFYFIHLKPLCKGICGLVLTGFPEECCCYCCSAFALLLLLRFCCCCSCVTMWFETVSWALLRVAKLCRTWDSSMLLWVAISQVATPFLDKTTRLTSVGARERGAAPLSLGQGAK